MRQNRMSEVFLQEVLVVTEPWRRQIFFWTLLALTAVIVATVGYLNPTWGIYAFVCVLCIQFLWYTKGGMKP